MTNEHIRLTLASDAELRRRIEKLNRYIQALEAYLARVAGRAQALREELRVNRDYAKRKKARIKELLDENAKLRKLVRSLNGEEPTP